MLGRELNLPPNVQTPDPRTLGVVLSPLKKKIQGIKEILGKMREKKEREACSEDSHSSLWHLPF